MDILHLLAAYPEVPLAILAFLFFVFLSHVRKAEYSIIQLPVVGVLPAALLNLHHVHDWVVTKVLEEKVFTTLIRGPWFSGMDFMMTSDPAVVQHVTSTKFNNFGKGDRFRENCEPLGVGVITADSDEWRAQRKVVMGLLHHPKFLSSIRGLTHQLLEGRLLPLLAHAAREEKPVDLQDIMLRFSFDIMCSLILGVDLCSLSPGLPEVPFAVAVNDVGDVIVSRFVMPQCLWKLLKWLQIGPERRLAKGMKVIDGFIYRVIETRREQLQREEMDDSSKTQDEKAARNAPQQFNVLTELLRNNQLYEKTDETGDFSSAGYDAKFIRDATVDLLVAAWQTTGVAMARLLWLLCMHPSVEARILDELGSTTTVTARSDMAPSRQQETAGGRMTTFHAEDLDSCVYFRGAINESLRLYAPIAFTARCPMQGDVLPSGEELAPGMLVLLSLYAMGRMQKTWGRDAAEFKPERWISKEGQLKEEISYKFAVFGAGPRMCVGKTLALASIKAVVASVAYNFRFRVAEGHDDSVRPNVVIHMKNGLKGSLHKRW
ncbi:hypothetical protein Taro_036800 [Colocasia esculenta]|uniref:Cytochrome P450 n=1 Tax=Colocasia esculenta TaxID=4460 RepID=A0A843W2H6_COLES|nr:hypothetical protein [Colocasia esculenta]